MPSSASADPRPSIDVVGLVEVLWRSWWIVVPGLLLTLAAAGVLPKLDNRAYQARAALFLIDSTSAAPVPGGGVNPYLQGNDSLVTTAQLLADSVESEAAERHARGEMPAIVAVNVPRRPPEPLLHILVTADSEAAANEDMQAVIALARARLAQIQADGDVRENQRVTALDVEASAPRQAESGKARPMVAIVVLGTALTVWSALLVDRRRARRHPTRPVEPTAADPTAATTRDLVSTS